MDNKVDNLALNYFESNFYKYKNNHEFIKLFIRNLSHYQSLSGVIFNINSCLIHNNFGKEYYIELNRMLKVIKNKPKILDEANQIIEAYQNNIKITNDVESLKQKKETLSLLSKKGSHQKDNIEKYYKNPDVSKDDNILQNDAKINNRSDRLEELLYKKKNGEIDEDTLFAEADLDELLNDGKRK